MKTKYAIIGLGPAALSAIEAIRKFDDGKMVCISYDDFPYSKAMLTDILKGAEPTQLASKDSRWVEKVGVEVLKGRAEDIDLERKRINVKVDRGVEELTFEKMLLATGGVAINPIKDKKTGLFTFTEMSDAKALRSYPFDSTVVVGAGFIGVELASTLRKIGKNVTVVELLERVLPIALDPEGSKIVEKMMRDTGIEIFLKDTVEEIKGDKVEAVKLRSGREIECQAVIVAIGVTPNVSLAKGIFKGRGIRPTEKMMVKSENGKEINYVFSAGDCNEVLDITDGKFKPIALWPSASEQGFVAGTNMAGGEAIYKGGFPVSSLKAFDVPVVSAGLSTGKKGRRLYVNEGEFLRSIYIEGGRLIGFVSIGAIQNIGLLTDAIRLGVNVSGVEEELLKPEINPARLPWFKERLKVTSYPWLGE